MERTSFSGVSSRRCCRSLQNCSTFTFFSISGWGIHLDYCDAEWFDLELRSFCLLRLHPSTEFWTPLLTMRTFSKGFWPTVVDIMVIWIKFAHSYPFLVHRFLKCQCSLLPSPAWPRPIHGPNIPGSYAIQRIFSRVVSNPSQVMPFGLHIVKG